MGIPVKLGMKQNVVHRVASICFLAVCTLAPLRAQKAPILAQAPTIRVQSSLVLVDVITQDRKRGLPIRDFKKENFRLFDNRREVPITTFDAGARHDTRAITLWLVVICNQGGLPKLGASAEFLGRNHSFDPHSTIWKPMTASELPIGATTVTPNWIYCLQKTAIRPSDNWLKRSSLFLSRAVRPRAMRLENRRSGN